MKISFQRRRLPAGVAAHGIGDDQFVRLGSIVPWRPQTTAGSPGVSRRGASPISRSMLEQDVVTSRGPARGLPGFVGKADAVCALLLDGDPIHREALTDELSRQGFVIRSFGDSEALLGALRDAVDVDVIVVVPKEASLDLLITLQRQAVNVPVVFLGAGARPAQADGVSKVQDLEVLARRLRSVAHVSGVRAFATDQVRHDEPVICGRLLLRPHDRRAYWNGRDVGVSFGEYNIIHRLVSDVGQYKTFRAVYDLLHYEGFIAGSGTDGYRANVRSVIKRIRSKFRALDPAFDEIQTYTGFGYCWRKPETD